MIRLHVFCFDEVIVVKSNICMAIAEGCTKQYLACESEYCDGRKPNGCSFAFNKVCFKDKF